MPEKQQQKDDGFGFGSTDRLEDSPVLIETPETKASTPAVGEAQEKRKRGRPKKDATKITNTTSKTITNIEEGETKPEKKKLNAREAFMARVQRKAGVIVLPPIKKLVEGKSGEEMKLSDIAVFVGTTSDPLLKEVQGSWKAKNDINLSTEVDLKTVENVGVEILKSGRVFMTIEVCKLPDGSMQCWSGRHRLVFLALAYGLEIKIPVSVTKMDVSMAHEAVVYANQSRGAKALEKAEHRVLRSVKGDYELEREALYKQAVQKKGDVSDFCVFSVFNKHEHGTKLKFPLMEDGRAEGLTTINNIRQFWKKSISWDNSMSRKEFDEQLRETCSFMNELVEKFQSSKGFDARQHMAAMPMVALGTVYRSLKDSAKNPKDMAKKIAESVISLGEIGRQKSDKTYNQLVKVLH